MPVVTDTAKTIANRNARMFFNRFLIFDSPFIINRPEKVTVPSVRFPNQLFGKRLCSYTRFLPSFCTTTQACSDIEAAYCP